MSEQKGDAVRSWQHLTGFIAKEDKAMARLKQLPPLMLVLLHLLHRRPGLSGLPWPTTAAGRVCMTGQSDRQGHSRVCSPPAAQKLTQQTHKVYHGSPAFERMLTATAAHNLLVSSQTLLAGSKLHLHLCLLAACKFIFARHLHVRPACWLQWWVCEAEHCC